MMPYAVAEIRRELCARAKCNAVVDHADPCAECPNGHWRIYSRKACEDGSAIVGQALPLAPAKIATQPWPLVLLPLKLLAKPDDRGAGDIIARVIGPIGGDAFKTWYKRIFGKECGCGARAETLNARYPL